MSNKPMSFRTFMTELKECELRNHYPSGLCFYKHPDTADERPFLVITPCLNFRTKNFLVLFRHVTMKSLQLASLYIVEDCPAIFDKDNKSEFFEFIKRSIRDFTIDDLLVELPVTSTSGMHWTNAGERTLGCMGPTVVIDFDPNNTTIVNHDKQTVIRYRSTDFVVTSDFFKGIAEIDRKMFAFQLVGNVYAKNK